MYLVIMSVDLTVLNFRLFLEHDDIVKNVYSRQLVLIIYELLDDFPDLFGKCLRNIAGKLPKGNQHFTQLKALATTIRTIRKRHETDFYAIRNIVVAHRDMNGGRQLETLQRIDYKTVFALASDIDLWIAKALRFLTMMIADYQFSRLQIREIARKIEQTAGALPCVPRTGHSETQ